MKRKSHYSELFFVGIAFIAFVIIGLTISLTIRACTRHNKIPLEDGELGTSNTSKIDFPVESHTMNHSYSMPDSIINMCMQKSSEDTPEIILHRTAYIVSYNTETKLPNWVAWNLSAEHTDGTYHRLNNFYEDEEVPYPRATLEDYRGSGWSRGHMCPAGDNKWNEKAMFDTFALTNVCPQNANLNSGLWNSIEMDCRNWARKFGDIYIVCGPIYMNREHEYIGNNQIIVPEAFFKVVLCLNGSPKGIGFIVRNTDGTRKRDLFYNTIDQVERITDIDFFPALADSLENAVEADANIKDWN